MGDIQFFSRHDIVKKATGIRFRGRFQGVDIRITVLYDGIFTVSPTVLMLQKIAL